MLRIWFYICCANFITIGEPPIVLYIYNMKTIIVIISKNKSKIKQFSWTKWAWNSILHMLYKFHQDQWTKTLRHVSRWFHYRNFHRKRSSLLKKIKYKINHEAWNIIREHIVLWLDAFIASKLPNNTQYTHICLSFKMRFWTFKRK